MASPRVPKQPVRQQSGLNGGWPPPNCEYKILVTFYAEVAVGETI